MKVAASGDFLDLMYSFHLPAGGEVATSNDLKSDASTYGFELNYNHFYGEEYGFILGGGGFNENTKYLQASPFLEYETNMLGIYLSTGIWYKFSENFQIINRYQFGVAELDIQTEGVDSKKIDSKVINISILGMSKIYEFYDTKNISTIFGIGVSNYYVNDFYYNNRNINGDSFEGDLQLKIGISFSF